MSKLSQVLKSHTDVNGVTLFDHINTFINEVLQSNHKDMNSIELLSDFTKKNRFLFKQLSSESEVNNLRDKIPEFADWVKRVSQLLKGQAVAQMPTILQDFVASARLLEAAGYGFGEEETYQIQLSIKQLSIETNATEMTFFGKILCRNSDYYVARGVVPKLPTDYLASNAEPRGDGVNYYTFWVTNDILTDWNELPLVTPEQIKVAREIKYVCTGNLNQELKTYPPFPGKEKHYLKAQLVRILHSNLIAPKGLYQQKEDNPKELEFVEEFKIPEFAELQNPDSWVHVPAQILKQGRITLYTDGLSEEAKNALLEANPDIDSETTRLKGIAEDRPLEPFYQSNWLIKTVGDQMIYNPKDDNSGNNVYATVILKNYTWSGAVTVANQNQWAFFYVGYGFKDTQAAYVPIQNNDLQLEPEDKQEFPEPNPKNPPKPPEPEKVEGQEGQDGQDQQADQEDQ
ncbi:unnamed protein product [Paramecium sonneborni]|uniref:Uncharacterized protein n=1 Tax=Paramecium sonneborni TaxID=65129 RepID=A0A8S1L2H1_9CILI|nr:unnamed protein product [Paramecium sonneborni]